MKITHPERIALFALAGLALILGLVVLIGSLAGVVITGSSPADGASVGPWQPVKVDFGQAMKADPTEKAFHISPAVPGQFQWENKELWFIPQKPYSAGQTYTVKLSAGAQGTDGRQLKKDFSFKFSIRQPKIIYISPAQVGSELWSRDLSGGQAQPLTDTGDSVIDFAVSRDGESIAYSVTNGQNGSDLWQMNRAGGAHKLLVNCGADDCSMPAWSWSGDRIAYSRKSRQNGPASELGMPRLWTVDTTSGQTAPLFQDASVAGDTPSWSPGGGYLSFYDQAHQGLHVLNLLTSQDRVIQTAYDQSGAWSPDGNRLFFMIELTAGDQTYLSPEMLDMTNGQMSNPLKSELSGVDASLPDWSPDGQSVAVGLRSLASAENKQIWILGLTQTSTEQVTQDLLYTQSAYHWNDDGSALVYQRYLTGRSDSQPEVVVWDKAARKAQLIAQNAALPAWLP